MTNIEKRRMTEKIWPNVNKLLIHEQDIYVNRMSTPKKKNRGMKATSWYDKHEEAYFRQAFLCSNLGTHKQEYTHSSICRSYHQFIKSTLAHDIVGPKLMSQSRQSRWILDLLGFNLFLFSFFLWTLKWVSKWWSMYWVSK